MCRRGFGIIEHHEHIQEVPGFVSKGEEGEQDGIVLEVKLIFATR